jgi:hypothetical protein
MTIITYPLFTLNKKPYEIAYSQFEIKIKKTKDSVWETLDDRTYGGDYFTRLIQMEYRVKFDYTCSNLQDIIFSDSRWGIDADAKIHDLPSFKKYKTHRRKVVRTSRNFIWIKYISYPFKLKTNQDLNFETGELYADVIKVDKKWYIKGFVNETS